MGIFDRFKSNKAAQGKARDMSDVAEQKINEKTGNKYESQVDAAQQKLQERLGMDENRPDKP
ncbi:antitoxin [Streptomyces sp. 3214.6]|uniref:antitoxin n=1 Tax=Streptomyces sp. 3214.6 TaxID=1882757 RepID=UPI00090C8833|nr:antitoxin [Streptomyces sp. 3214.6]SHI20132.1 MT0933-like antitoxin protein [Streptomyces sp. 3214.6]